jgi:colicin import membrane protein
VALKIPFNPSEPGYWVSGVAHVALIAAGLMTLSAPRFPDVDEGIPVEVVTENQLSQITKGETTAKQAQPTPKPRVDRVAEAVQQRDPGEDKRDAPAPPKRPADLKVADKDEDAPAPAPPPRPEPKPDPARDEAVKAEKAAAEAREKAEAKAAAAKEKAEAESKAAAAKERAEAQAKALADAEARAKAEAEADARAEAEAKRVAEARAKAEADAEAKRVARADAEAKAKAEAEAKRVADAKAEAEAKRVADAKAKAEVEAKRVAEAKEAEAKARKDAELAKKLDVGDLRQFLNKEKNQSTGATGAEVQKTAALGAASGTAAKLNPSLRDSLLGLLQDQILRCYSPPIGATMGNVTMPLLNLQFNADGSLSAEPRVIRSGGSAADRAIAEAALRAVRRCAPYRVPAQFAPYYNEWKNMNALFEAPPA